MHINPDRYRPPETNLKELEELLKVCNWNWDIDFDEGSDEQTEAYASYGAVEEYIIALRRKIIEIDKNLNELRKVNVLINKYAPPRYQVPINS